MVTFLGPQGYYLHTAKEGSSDFLDGTQQKTVLDILKEKHPQARGSNHSPTHSVQPHPIIYEQITASTIKTAALRTKGAAGPSGLDAHQWRRLCSSFKTASADLCHSLALVAMCLCSSTIKHHSYLTPLLACRLIALDKCPGVRPIGICETQRRIIAKS